MKVAFSRRAKADLREIGLYIARDNKARGIAFGRRLQATGQKIGSMPGAYPVVAVSQLSDF